MTTPVRRLFENFRCEDVEVEELAVSQSHESEDHLASFFSIYYLLFSLKFHSSQRISSKLPCQFLKILQELVPFSSHY